MPSKFYVLIDDDPIDQLIASRIIEKYDPTLLSIPFSNGQKALEFLEECVAESNVKIPSFILVDLTMPIMSGHEFLQHYRNKYYPLLYSIPVFILSSSINEDDRNKCLSLPFVTDFLIKPLTKNNIKDKILSRIQ